MNTKILLPILIATCSIIACNSAKKTQETVVEETEKVVEDVQEVIEKVTTTQKSDEKEVEMNNDKTDAKLEKTSIAAEQFLGEYEWAKTYCCGRLRNTYEPKPGTSRTLTITQDNISDTGGTSGDKAAAYSSGYVIDSENQMFPGEHLLKVGKSPAALLKLDGDTLLVDRGYIDLERTWWFRKK